jgi:hypothetical protein
MSGKTYLTTEQLAEKLCYDPRYIRTSLKDVVFLEGIHYIRFFGRRRVYYIWETIERDMVKASTRNGLTIPMAGGKVCHG